ncbi:hypothetical protein BKA93DRAFT_250637 [Sparassis latifolia]
MRPSTVLAVAATLVAPALVAAAPTSLDDEALTLRGVLIYGRARRLRSARHPRWPKETYFYAQIHYSVSREFDEFVARNDKLPGPKGGLHRHLGLVEPHRRSTPVLFDQVAREVDDIAARGRKTLPTGIIPHFVDLTRLPPHHRSLLSGEVARCGWCRSSRRKASA